MLSDLDILGREAGSSPPSLSSALGGLTPIKYPPFPPAVKSMRGTHLRFDVSALILTGVSTGEER